MEEFVGLMTGVLLVLLTVAIIYYVLMAYPLMKIAQRTNTENAWLAWIPIANLFLVAFIAKKEWWWALIAILVSLIPIVGSFASLGIMVYLMWLICERLNKPGPLSLLFIFPIVQIILLFYLAFSKD